MKNKNYINLLHILNYFNNCLLFTDAELTTDEQINMELFSNDLDKTIQQPSKYLTALIFFYTKHN